MSDPSATGAVPDLPPLGELLRDLPEAQVAVITALMRDRDRAAALAERRAERLQRLHEVSATLSRSVDRDGIERELARQVARMIPCAGVVVARPSADGASSSVSLYWRDSAERDIEGAAPALPAIAEVVRTARSIGAGASAKAGPVGAGPAVVAVPLMVGYKLTGILAVIGNEAEVFETEDEELLDTVGATAATALVNAMLFVDSEREITEERAMLEQTVRREKMAALGELVGGVAHEVNSPLTSILAFGQMLQVTQADADVESRKAVDSIVNEAKRAARIVGKFLMLTRQQPSEKMRTDLNQILLDTVELRRYALTLQDIVINLELSEQLPPIWADPFQLQQVFINLLNNAEQALTLQTAERRITVRTERRGDDVMATITDSGLGIAPEHLPNIFNPFYTTKARGIGTGLGLSISFGIVRDHNGMLRVRSEPGAGASFEVTLPIVAPPSGNHG